MSRGRNEQWEQMKQKIREAEWQRAQQAQEAPSPPRRMPPSTDGPAAGPTPTESAAPVGDRSKTVATPTPTISATSAPVTAPTAVVEVPTSTGFAASTPTPSDVLMAWKESPIGFVERDWQTSTLDLNGLPPRVQSSLQMLATGRNEPLEAIVHQIASFFVETESEYAEGTLEDAVTFYVANYVY